MNYIQTEIDGVWIIEPRVFNDARGYFMEAFKEEEFRANIGDVHFVQDNESKSSFGVLRGLHYQKGEYSQAKLVRVIKGKVLDVAVDLRRSSPTFGKYVSVEQIEAKPLPLSSKVAVDKEDFQNLVTAAQKFVVQEKQEGKLNKLLKDAKKTIANLKAKIESLVTELSAVKAELAQYKSVRGKLRTADLEQENDRLRSRLRTYDDVISRNNLWHFFSGSRGKNRNRDDAR